MAQRGLANAHRHENRHLDAKSQIIIIEFVARNIIDITRQSDNNGISANSLAVSTHLAGDNIHLHTGQRYHSHDRNLHTVLGKIFLHFSH